MYSSIDTHWKAQQAVRGTETALADIAQQHRAVQKRLLMRFKDRQPSSVAHLDLLLADTFQQLLQLGAAMLFFIALTDPSYACHARSATCLRSELCHSFA